MKSYIVLPKIHLRELPEKFKGNDNRFPENLVRIFLQEFTQEGDLVLDIFAGLGTTLFVSEEMGRIPFGIEYNKERFEYIKENLQNKGNLIFGDSLKLSSYNLPQCDFCFASPPFMKKEDKENPFTNCSTKGDYQKYLGNLKNIYSQVQKVMKKEAYIIIDVANLKGEEGLTTLAWDIGKAVSEVLLFVGEIVIIWETRGTKTVDGHSEHWRVAGTYGYGYDHSYCLVFKNI